MYSLFCFYAKHKGQVNEMLKIIVDAPIDDVINYNSSL